MSWVCSWRPSAAWQSLSWAQSVFVCVYRHTHTLLWAAAYQAQPCVLTLQTLNFPQPCRCCPVGHPGRPGPLLHRHPRQLWRLRRLRQLREHPGVSLHECHHRQPAGLPSGWGPGHQRCQHLSLQRVSLVEHTSTCIIETSPGDTGLWACLQCSTPWLGQPKSVVCLACPCLGLLPGRLDLPQPSHLPWKGHAVSGKGAWPHPFDGSAAPGWANARALPAWHAPGLSSSLCIRKGLGMHCWRSGTFLSQFSGPAVLGWAARACPALCVPGLSSHLGQLQPFPSGQLGHAFRGTGTCLSCRSDGSMCWHAFSKGRHLPAGITSGVYNLGATL